MSPRARKLARRLLRENRGTRSRLGRPWRTIAREDYEDKIPNGTLCRFAKSEGEWLPKHQHQVTLGLKSLRKPRTVKHKHIVGWMLDVPPKTLIEMLDRREPMP